MASQYDVSFEAFSSSRLSDWIVVWKMGLVKCFGEFGRGQARHRSRRSSAMAGINEGCTLKGQTFCD
jgi:hypothetical protein